jgi:hypothetical protein
VLDLKVLHELPGRIRLFVPELSRKEDAMILRAYLQALDGVIKCTVNQRCSSVLFIYDAKRIQVEHIESQIELTMQYLKTIEATEKHTLLAELSYGLPDLQARQRGAAQKVIFFSLAFLLYKWKQAQFGKFALSRSVPWLQVSSLVTIIGGYPLLKGCYKKCIRELPGDSEDLLKQSSVFFTLVRESTKGVFVLVLKTLNDWIKFSADLNNHTLWQQGTGEGHVKLQLLKGEKSREIPSIHLDDVHQPENSYERGITGVALSGAVLSYLFTGSGLNAMAVLLLMSPSAENAAVSSGLNNCVYRLSRQKVLVPDPNRLIDISECENIVIHQDLISRELADSLRADRVPGFIIDLQDLGLKVYILVNQTSTIDPVFQNAALIRGEEISDLPGKSVLVINAVNDGNLLPDYTILFDVYQSDHQADILVFERKLSDLPDILKEIWYARKVINQSVLFTKAFNIWYGANAILQPFDAFAAKSLNTTNSLVALLSNQRIFAKK